MMDDASFSPRMIALISALAFVGLGLFGSRYDLRRTHLPVSSSNPVS